MSHHNLVLDSIVIFLQEDIGYKTRRAVEAKMEALKAVHQEHKQSEKDREMAVRYHRVRACPSSIKIQKSL